MIIFKWHYLYVSVLFIFLFYTYMIPFKKKKNSGYSLVWVSSLEERYLHCIFYVSISDVLNNLLFVPSHFSPHY